MASFLWLMMTAILLTVVLGEPYKCKGTCPAINPNGDVFLLAHENCSMYCSCVDGKPIEHPCPADLHYSPKHRNCTHPSEAQCPIERDNLCLGICPVEEITKTAVILAHQDCTKFCKCVNGIPYERNCPVGYHFSPTLGVCTYPHEAECPRQEGSTAVDDCCPCPTMSDDLPPSTNTTTGLSSSTSAVTVTEVQPDRPTDVTTTESFSTVTVTETQPETSTAPTTTESPTTLTITTPEICTNETIGLALPHEFDCSLYYECVYGNLLLRQCPKDLLFSPKKHGCVLASESECVSITTISTTPASVTTPSIDISKLCPADGTKDGEFYPHEYACNQYYICAASTLHPHQCKKNLLYNPKIYACDKPENVNCSSISTEKPSTTPIPTTTISIPTECPEVDSEKPVQIAHPKNCSLYYRCVKGQKVLQFCIKPLHFNPKQQLCDWPELAGCTAKEESTETSIPSTSSVTTASTECPKDFSITQIAHETSCTLYYECKDGKKKLKRCVLGLQFNPVLHVCDWPDSAGCSN